MIRQSTIESLKIMRLGGMAAELERQMADAEGFRDMPFEDRLALLVNAESAKRQVSKYERCMRMARFPLHGATMEGIEYYEDRRLSKTQMLTFASCRYIEEGHHIILKGASGNGKTYIASALGEAACRKFLSVRYIRMPELLDELGIAKAGNEFKKVVGTYRNVDLLVLDEWLIRCLTPEESYNLFEIIEARSQHGSTIFCTQYETKGWYKRINPDPNNDSPISEAIMDRIIHNAYEVLIDGDKSMRERHGLNAGVNV